MMFYFVNMEWKYLIIDKNSISLKNLKHSRKWTIKHQKVPIKQHQKFVEYSFPSILKSREELINPSCFSDLYSFDSKQTEIDRFIKGLIKNKKRFLSPLPFISPLSTTNLTQKKNNISTSFEGKGSDAQWNINFDDENINNIDISHLLRQKHPQLYEPNLFCFSPKLAKVISQ